MQINKPKEAETKTWLDSAERWVDNLLRILWIVFIIKIVFYGYS